MKKAFLFFGLLLTCGLAMANIPESTLPFLTEPTDQIESGFVSNSQSVHVNKVEEPNICYYCSNCKGITICTQCTCTNAAQCAQALDALVEALCALDCCVIVSPD